MILWREPNIKFSNETINKVHKLKENYSEKMSLDSEAIAFLFQGKTLHHEQTPDQVFCRFLSSFSIFQKKC